MCVTNEFKYRGGHVIVPIYLESEEIIVYVHYSSLTYRGVHVFVPIYLESEEIIMYVTYV